MTYSVRPPLARRGPEYLHATVKGQIRSFSLESGILRENPWGDPSVRELSCYLPPSGVTEGRPLLVLLSGFTGAGWLDFQRANPFQEGLVQLFDRMVRQNLCSEAVVVSPDCLTSLGGSQYVNSSATGRYADYVVREVIPWARERFRTRGVGVLGQSSGGFGALHLAMEYPAEFQAVGSSAGDMAFDYCYLPDFPRVFRELRAAGGPERWLESIFEEPSRMKGPNDISGAVLDLLAMASCYSPTEGAAGCFDLPFDVETGALLPDVWSRWLAFDPIRRLADPAVQKALRSLRSVHVTGSAGDEFFLDVGVRMFAAEAAHRSIPVLHEEFPGGHFVRVPRFRSLFGRMVEVLSGNPPSA